MNKIILCLFILIYPNFLFASDTELVIESNLTQIQKYYADSYLTFKGSLKVWYGKTLSNLEISLAKDLEKFIERREIFRSSVSSYNWIVSDYSLNLGLSPKVFKAAFNNEVKNRLGKDILKKLNLDIDKKYPAPGE